MRNTTLFIALLVLTTVQAGCDATGPGDAPAEESIFGFWDYTGDYDRYLEITHTSYTNFRREPDAACYEVDAQEGTVEVHGDTIAVVTEIAYGTETTYRTFAFDDGDLMLNKRARHERVGLTASDLDLCP